MFQVWRVDDGNDTVRPLVLDVSPEDIVKAFDSRRLEARHFFVVKLVPTTDIWED